MTNRRSSSPPTVQQLIHREQKRRARRKPKEVEEDERWERIFAARHRAPASGFETKAASPIFTNAVDEEDSEDAGDV
jgi:hypothetical protein